MLSTSFAQSKIKRLTSKEKSQEIASQIDNVTTTQAPSRNTRDSAKKHSVGIGLGQTFVKGDLENHGADQITADLLYNYAASHSFDMMANFHHSKHNFKNEFAQLTGLALGIKAKLLHFDKFTPFVAGGLGFYNPQVKRVVNGALAESESKVVFGTHFGLGGDLRLNQKFSMGIMAHYHNPFDVRQEIGSEVEGSYMKLLITGLYHF